MTKLSDFWPVYTVGPTTICPKARNFLMELQMEHSGMHLKYRPFNLCSGESLKIFMASFLHSIKSNLADCINIQFFNHFFFFFCRYPIYGGMQDWNYIHHGCFELTLEISDDKWPNASEVRPHSSSCNYFSIWFEFVLLGGDTRIINPGLTHCLIFQLPTVWEYNRMSMLNIASSVIKVHSSRCWTHYYVCYPSQILYFFF